MVLIEAGRMKNEMFQLRKFSDVHERNTCSAVVRDVSLKASVNKDFVLHARIALFQFSVVACDEL